MTEHDTESKLGTYSDELRSGIFHLSVSMCQHLAMSMPMDVAKEQTASWLEEIARGLREIKENPVQGSN